MRFSWPIALGCLAGILLLAVTTWAPRKRILAGVNDFLMFYTGAKLAGTPDLYNPVRIREVQLEAAGATGENYLYTRLPYLAVLLRPLAWLPYRTAYGLWQLLALAAFAGFLALWRATPLPLTALFGCLSLPLGVSFMNGQDLPLLLLWIALAMHLERRGSSFAAGLVFSLCAAKYHLFLLLPVLLLAQKRGRFAGGLAAGGAALLALCFAASGPGWPRQYYAMLTNPKSLEGVEQMPNLHGLFLVWPHAALLEGLFAASVVLATWRAVRHASFELGLAATLAGSLLVSVHAYVADAVLLLPAALVIYAEVRAWWVRALAVILLLPVGYFLLLSLSPVARALAPVTTLLLVYSLAMEGGARPWEKKLEELKIS